MTSTPTSAATSSCDMSSENPEDQRKWVCEVCTFENWMATAKCTMCRGTRTKQSNNDIFKLGSGMSPPGPRSISPFELNNQNKWSCCMCTYLNWPRSARCAQCLYPKRRVSPVVSRNSPISPRSQHIVLPESTNNNRPVSTSPPPAPVDHLATVMESKLEVENRNNNSPSPPDSSKWDCAACTYENWPKAKCCVICGVPKGGVETVEDTAKSPSITRRNNEEENNLDYERRLRQLRRRLRETDWSWLTACMGVVEGDLNPVEAYLNSGGDAARKLTNPETSLLNCNRPVAVFEAGHTLVHLAIKFHREDMLATLLSQFESHGTTLSGVKCVPSYVAPDLASGIRRHISQAVRQRKGPLPCYYLSEWATYSMPSEIEDLPPATQEQLYSEIMDKDAQKELEEDCGEDSSSAINWSEEIRISLGSRLHALWNRSAGDCLLDSVLQATWGVFDRDNTLRTAMADSLHETGNMFYPRWKEWELRQALDLHYTLDDAQLAEDWSGILSLASKPGASLEQVHVFCLAHVLRRPIIVYGVKYVKSWRGENLGFARFEGVYLPLLWESSFCCKSPIALGYTRGHFCALVPPEPVRQTLAGSRGASGGPFYGATNEASAATTPSSDQEPESRSTFLPLVTADRKQYLPIPYLNQNEVGSAEVILRQWLDVRVTDSGLVVAVQKMTKPPLLVAQMTEEWLNHYRKLAQSSTAPFSSRAAAGSSNINNNIRRVRRASPRSGGARSPSGTLATSSTGHSCTTVTPTGSPGTGTPGSSGNPAPSTGSVPPPSHNVNTSCYSSDGDSDEE